MEVERERRRRRAVRFVVGAEQVGEEVLRKFSDRSLDNRFICRTPLACFKAILHGVESVPNSPLPIFQEL